MLGRVRPRTAALSCSPHPTPPRPLLQRRGIKLNPITTLYLIAPCCFAFLCFPFVSELG